MLVGLKRISMAFGLLAATALSAQAQNTVPSTNQATANAVAESLRASKSLSRYRIDIETQGGAVTLSGVVANQAQRNEAIARVQQVAGVLSVRDQLSVAKDRRVRPVQYQFQTAMGGHHFGGHGGGDIIYEDGPAAAAAPAAPVTTGPVPMGPAGGAVPTMENPGYPTTYPWAAQANAVPAVPYPEVPLGWERVTLRWDDGIWWLDFKKNYTRPFFTPWPFQLWSY